ncbi:MAG: MoaD/ThiS family protein [Phycisphaeraceae bacterium]|nr:MoaD/ThiS family protein [Phycisphaeraceae bacterium]
MKIRFLLWGQLKAAAQADSINLDISDPHTVENAITCLADSNDQLKGLLIGESHGCHKSILVFANGVQVMSDTKTSLEEGMEITLMSPIAGG